MAQGDMFIKIHSRSFTIAFLLITHEWCPYSPWGNIWVSLVSLKCGCNLTFDATKVCAKSCYIASWESTHSKTYNAVTFWRGQFSPISSRQALPGSLVRTSHGVSAVRFKSDPSPDGVIVTLCVISRQNGSRCGDTGLYMRLDYILLYHMQMYVHAHVNWMRLYSEFSHQ